ncbi:cytochrome P450 4C1-like [Odontomachus brunneus]|uniref:cytochrome P450 4C1-like n=1 Tax=Odontomachus brunneus TaxID=486640 RepID=UPI0013F1B8CC|nr:cytochrome P450 4C1-like [Odontomachus brunneus]XP_032675661.1 cytochrome P450 4C1-like [Odontomachus brunneus]
MLTSVALITLVCIGIIYLIPKYRKRLRFVQMANALPGPKTQPIIGNAYYLLQRNFDELLNSISFLTGTYPSPFRFWLYSKLIIGVTDPDQMKTILQSPNCINKSIMYEPTKALVGNGLLTAPAHIWVQRRKMLASSFNTNILRASCDIFVKHVSVFIGKIEYMLNDEVDLLHHIAKCSLDMIFDITLNFDLGLQLKENMPYDNAMARLTEIFTYRMRNILLFPDIIFNFTSLSREQQKLLNVIYSTAEEVIQQRENARDNLVGNKNQSTKPSRRVYLDILMEASDNGKKLTRKDIIDEINTIIVTGFDTVTNMLNFLMFILANFQEVQQKVYEELLEIYGTQDPKSAPVKFEDLQHMKYMECVIKETLRLFPVAAIIGRQLNADLQIGEYTLPEGAEVYITILDMHRNEKYWPKAMTFDPDRFLPQNMANIHPNSYLPFSYGARNCLGIKYAMISMKVFTATFLRTYKLKVDKRVKIEEIELKLSTVLAPVNSLKVRIEKRM